MNTLYKTGTLLLVCDPYTHADVICVVMGVCSVNVFEERDDILYHGYSLNDNGSYYFFDTDIVCRIEDY